MKFRIQADDLNEALSVVSIVPPRPVTNKGGAGFLFVVNGQTCRIYSRDGKNMARAEVQVEEVDGEGAFIYPSDKIGVLRFVSGWIEIEAGHDAKDDRYWVKYDSEGGAVGERSSYDPRLMQSIDKALDAATTEHVFPSAVLKEAINLAKSYLAKVNDGRVQENFKTMQVFDTSNPKWAKGDGTLFASDRVRACYFFCEVFKGKGLSIHGQHLPFILSFLSKSEGDITIKQGPGATFAVNSKNVLGWVHHVAEHGDWKYYPANWDQFVLRAPKDILLRALRQVRAGLDPKRDKIRIEYEHVEKSLRFKASEGSGKDFSMPVGVVPIEEEGSGKKGATDNFAKNASVDHLINIIEPAKGHEVDLRVAIVKPKDAPRERALFRTIEEFWLSDAGKVLIASTDEEKAYQCRVTRYMPSKD